MKVPIANNCDVVTQENFEFVLPDDGNVDYVRYFRRDTAARSVVTRSKLTEFSSEYSTFAHRIDSRDINS